MEKWSLEIVQKYGRAHQFLALVSKMFDLKKSCSSIHISWWRSGFACWSARHSLEMCGIRSGPFGHYQQLELIEAASSSLAFWERARFALFTRDKRVRLIRRMEKKFSAVELFSSLCVHLANGAKTSRICSGANWKTSFILERYFQHQLYHFVRSGCRKLSHRSLFALLRCRLSSLGRTRNKRFW